MKNYQVTVFIDPTDDHKEIESKLQKLFSISPDGSRSYQFCVKSDKDNVKGVRNEIAKSTGMRKSQISVLPAN